MARDNMYVLELRWGLNADKGGPSGAFTGALVFMCNRLVFMCKATRTVL
jgi:hypothetical protein